jgi:general secretion pathway protein H
VQTAVIIKNHKSTLLGITRNAGFTLIEIMVVILIVGLIVGVASSSLSNRSAITERVALKEFANRLAMVLSESALSGKAWGIRIERIPPGAAIYKNESNDNSVNDSETDLFAYHWLLLQDDQTWKYATPAELDEQHTFPESTDIVLNVENNPAEITSAVVKADEDNPLKPQIFLLPSGEVSPFSVEISSTEKDDPNQKGLLLSVDTLGRITLPKAED